MDILEQMIARAKANPQRIVLPEGDEPRTLEAANILLRDKIAHLILIGDPEKIKGMAAEKGYEYIKEAKIVDPLHDAKMGEYANLLYELRKSKGMTEEEAAKKAQDPLYLGCLMIKAGDADGELAGARHNGGHYPSGIPDSQNQTGLLDCERCIPYVHAG